jgi:hypothetical protein
MMLKNNGIKHYKNEKTRERPAPSMAQGYRVVGQKKRRITGLYALRGLAAPRPPQWLGHSLRSIPTPHSTHILAGLQSYGLLIRPAQTSPTAGTLYEMGANIV